MLRTQIQVTEEQNRRLRVFAERRGLSLSEAIRIGIDRLLEEESMDRREMYALADALIGKLEDLERADDLGEDHDDYLEEAYQ